MPAPPPPPRKEPADWESRFNFKTDIPQPQMYMPMPKTYPSKDATMKGMSVSLRSEKLFFFGSSNCVRLFICSFWNYFNLVHV